jgi:aryl-alcohol dehydrogenase-like predicted oxidoreductase
MSKRLALGTVQFGLNYGIANTTGQVPASEVKHMLGFAAAHGIDTLDTAIAYGESESQLGQAGVAQFKLVTKLPEIPDGVDVAQWVLAQIKGSLKRLQTTSVYGVLLHRPAQLKSHRGREIASALAMLKQRSLTEKIGVSIYAPDELEGLAIEKFDLVQAPYNLVDRRLFTSGAAQRLLDSGLEIHTRSAFLQGLLLMPTQSRPAKFERWNQLWSRWREWLEAHQVSAVEACLGFALSKPGIARVVVGVETRNQLQELLNSTHRPELPDWPDLSSEDLALINPSAWTQL